jgi:large subunit ribosomal protein L30
MSFFKITLHRSAIGLPERTRGVLMALGLRRRCQTVFHPVSPQFAGMIMKVKELVKVEEVAKALSKAEMKDLRRPPPGFYIERRASQAAGTNLGKAGDALSADML